MARSSILSAISKRSRVRTHHWSEGPATYNLALKLRATREIEFGRFVVQTDAERYLSVLTGMIGTLMR